MVFQLNHIHIHFNSDEISVWAWNIILKRKSMLIFYTINYTIYSHLNIVCLAGFLNSK